MYHYGGLGLKPSAQHPKQPYTWWNSFTPEALHLARDLLDGERFAVKYGNTVVTITRNLVMALKFDRDTAFCGVWEL